MTLRKIGSISCFVVAIAAVIFAIFAGGSKGLFVGLAFFRVVKDGGFLGFIGNIFGILITFVGFAAAGYFGFSKDDKKALIVSGLMTAVCIVSMIFSIFNGTFSVGDLIIIAPSALILISLFTSK